VAVILSRSPVDRLIFLCNLLLSLLHLHPIPVHAHISACYGDIGTSPLYVFSSTFLEPPEKDELLCAVSLIIYSLTIMVSIKYVCIAMYADDAGEGGTFALYSLLARYAKIEDREPGKASKGLDRYLTADIGRVNRSVRSTLENKRTFKLAIRMVAIFGACCVMADGVFTPAQSVLGAIQGARVYNPGLPTGAIIGISIAIIIPSILPTTIWHQSIGAMFCPSRSVLAALERRKWHLQSGGL